MSAYDGADPLPPIAGMGTSATEEIDALCFVELGNAILRTASSANAKSNNNVFLHCQTIRYTSLLE